MKFYLRGLALGAAWIVVGLLIQGLIGPIASDDDLKMVSTISLIVGFMLFGFFYRKRYGPLWPMATKSARNGAVLFLLGSGTVVALQLTITFLKHNPAPSSVLLIILIDIITVVAAFQLGWVTFIGSLFCRNKEVSEATIKFEVVARGRSTTQLEILQARLNAEGIPAFILNGGMNQMLPLGGAGLEVPESYANEARELISAVDSGALASTDAG